MIIKLDVDTRPLVAKLEALRGPKGVAYAVVGSINDTGLLAQKVVREHVQERFEVRKPEFTLKQAAIFKRASVRDARPYAEIFVGQKPRLLLSLFEAGGERPKVGATQSVPVIGNAARPTFASIIPPALRTKQLAFKREFSKAGPARYAGKLGTYTVPDVGIFQRHPGAHSELLYGFVHDERIKPELELEPTVQRVAAIWYRRFMEQQLATSIAYAEARKGAA